MVKVKRLKKHESQLRIHARILDELTTLTQMDILAIAEGKAIARKNKILERAAEAYGKAKTDVRALIGFLNWISFLVNTQCMITEKVDKTQDSKVREARQKIKSRWFNLVYRVLKRFKRSFPQDFGVDITILDYLLRCGCTSVFDRMISEMLMHNPRSKELWLLAIDRQRQAGNLLPALRLAQKGRRLVADDNRVELDKTIMNLSLFLVISAQLSDQSWHGAHSIAASVDEMPNADEVIPLLDSAGAQ